MDTQERVTSLVLNGGGSPEIVAGILAIFAEERAALDERVAYLEEGAALQVVALGTAEGRLGELQHDYEDTAQELHECQRDRDKYHDDLNNWRSQCMTEMNRAEQVAASEAKLAEAATAAMKLGWLHDDECHPSEGRHSVRCIEARRVMALLRAALATTPATPSRDHGACVCSWSGERITWFNESCPVHSGPAKGEATV